MQSDDLRDMVKIVILLSLSLRITAVGLRSSAHFICSEVIQLLSVVLLYLRGYCTGALLQGWHCR